ncbi:site-2 protease family protein [Halorhabdus salina]|uniref:site-2 protease family protein n=1 Tax=Halorhabdus salina TaxID=2750670 RepID=UPI0015EEE809|nr:site-2 protease family protein [Halorhabdus salina]
MRRIRIGSAFGIPIQLDFTFLLVLPLFAWIIGAQVGQSVELMNEVWGAGIPVEPLSTGAFPYVLGITAAVGLFACVVLHELGHSVVAMRFGFPISSITLWLFGGIAQLEEMPEDWKQELFIAIAGPAVSVGLAGISYAGFWLVPTGEAVGIASLKFLLGYFALMNLALAIFNMLPGFPMDGGRVLRALLARNRPYARATQIAAEVGKLFALLLGLFGLFGGGSPFLIAIAFFIYIGASSEAQMTTMKAAFEGVTVRDVMTPADRVQSVETDMSVAELMELMFRERHTGFPVVKNDEIVGLVTLEDARAVREVEREAFTVSDVMTTDLRTIGPDEDAMAALTRLQENNIGRLLVMEADEFAGLLTRTDLMTALDIIKQSGRDRVVGGGSFGGRDIPTTVREAEDDVSNEDRRFGE